MPVKYLPATEVKNRFGRVLREVARTGERHNAILARFVALPLDSDAARLAGSWMQKYAAAGLGWMDALIAASGKVAGLPLLTRDSRLARVLSVEVEFELYAL